MDSKSSRVCSGASWFAQFVSPPRVRRRSHQSSQHRPCLETYTTPWFLNVSLPFTIEDSFLLRPLHCRSRLRGVRYGEARLLPSRQSTCNACPVMLPLETDFLI